MSARTRERLFYRGLDVTCDARLAPQQDAGMAVAGCLDPRATGPRLTVIAFLSPSKRNRSSDCYRVADWRSNCTVPGTTKGGISGA